MDKLFFGLCGAGGFAREVMPFVGHCTSELARNEFGLGVDVCFVETNPKKSQVNGRSVLSESDFFQVESKTRFFNVAIGDSRVRQAIADRFVTNSICPFTLISPNALVYEENDIGEGAIVCANSIITSNVVIGKFFHSNIYSYVAHDCVIGDYVTFAPNVHCNGNVHIGDHAYIGTGAIIKQGEASNPLVIGEGAVVGMGAVVTKDVPPYTTVIGNPARPLVK